MATDHWTPESRAEQYWTPDQLKGAWGTEAPPSWFAESMYVPPGTYPTAGPDLVNVDGQDMRRVGGSQGGSDLDLINSLGGRYDEKYGNLVQPDAWMDWRKSQEGFWDGPGPFMLALTALGAGPFASSMGLYGAGTATSSGAAASTGAGGFSSNLTGLYQMATDAGLFGPAADAFAMSGGGSTLAGGAGWAIPTAGSAAVSGATGGGMGDFMELLRKMGIRVPGTGSTMGNVFDIGRGLYGLYQGNQMQDLAERAMQANDPFGPERAGYAEKLRQLYANPSMVEQIPGYQQGLNAVRNKMESQGYAGSGNMMLGLHKYGGDFFDKEANRLAQLAGAQFPPRGGDALLTGNAMGANLTGNALNSLVYGALGLFGDRDTGSRPSGTSTSGATAFWS